MAKLRPMPTQAVPVVDMQTGLMTQEWFLYFKSRERAALSNLSDVSSAAPSDTNILTFNGTTGLWEPA